MPQGERAELAVLEKVVQVLLQHLKHEARVVLVLETLVRADKVELICVLCAQPAEDAHLQGRKMLVSRYITKTPCKPLGPRLVEV